MLSRLGQLAGPLIEFLLEIRQGRAPARSRWRFTALDPRCLLAARLHLVNPGLPVRRLSAPTINQPRRHHSISKFARTRQEATVGKFSKPTGYCVAEFRPGL